MPSARSSLAWRRRFVLSLAGAVGVGSALRLWHLGRQIILGDELHLLHAVLRVPLPKILATYGLTDYCLPLAGFARALLDAGHPVTEWVLRGPVVASGLLTLVALPLAARSWTERRPPAGAPVASVHLVYPWLLALSPALVLYGRIARSYAPATLFAGLAAFAFLAWWRGRGWRYGLVYVLAAALAVYTHLGVAPFVVAPFAVAAGELVLAWRERRKRETPGGPGEALAGRPGWGALVILGLCLTAALASFLVPGWESLSAVLGGKPGLGRLEAATVVGAAFLQAGTSSGVMTLLFWGLAVAGLLKLWRHDGPLAVYTGVLVAAQIAGIVALSPFGLAEPVILNRYLLVGLPLVLFWVAWGLAPADGAGRRGRRGGGSRALRWAAAGVVVAALVATGPLVRPRFAYGSFLHAYDGLGYHASLPVLPPEAVPAVYHRLAEIPLLAPDEALVEYPAYPETRNRSLAAYQDVHRRAVVLAVPVAELGEARLGLRNHVPPRPEEILATRARFLVAHRDLGAEERAVPVPPGRKDPWRAREENLSRRFQAIAPGQIAAWTELWGPPAWDDGRAVVWDLDRVRADPARP